MGFERIGEHYNNLIWTVIGGAIAFTIIILFHVWTNEKLTFLMKISSLILGYLILVYSSLVIESFGEKKDLAYSKIQIRLDVPMKGKLKYLEIPILSIIFLLYIGTLIWLIYGYLGKDILISLLIIFSCSIMFLFLFVW